MMIKMRIAQIFMALQNATHPFYFYIKYVTTYFSLRITNSILFCKS